MNYPLVTTNQQQALTTQILAYDELVAQKLAIVAQLKAIALVLHDQSSPEVRELISGLQFEKTKQETLIDQAEKQLAQIRPKLESMDKGAERILLEAISQQSWYAFKNKREIIFDSRTGDLYANFEYVPHVTFGDWPQAKKTYAPSGVKGDWQMLHEVFRWDEKKNRYSGFLNSDEKHDYYYSSFDYPIRFRGVKDSKIYVYSNPSSTGGYCYAYFEKFSKNYASRDQYDSRYQSDKNIFPVLKVLDNSDILPDFIRITTYEKAKVILEFFIAKDWIPIFEPFLDKIYDEIGNVEDEDDYQSRVAIKQKECDEYNCLFDAYYQRIQLERQLVAVEQRLAELPPPEPDNPFTAAFDYRQALKDQQYDLVYISQSVWQYSLAVQDWIWFLLDQLDDISQRQQPLLSQAAQLTQSLSAKSLNSKHLSQEEKQLLQARHTDLQQRLDFGIEAVRLALFDMLQQAQALEQQLQQAHQHSDSLSRLAYIEAHQRPSFALVAEHSATLCTQVLTKLEWLEQSVDFVQAILQSEQQLTAHYLVLLDKHQADLLQHGADNSIDASEVRQWFAEWREQQWVVQQQWQPLVHAGLNNLLPQSTVLNVLRDLQTYQQAIDRFYLTQRLGIHTQYAFQPNGHRQEKLEKEQKLNDLKHQLMQHLQQIIFALPSSVEKIWLVRWVEVWQQGLLKEINNILQHENLLERDDIIQIMLEDMRKVQQQNLAACLQDAKSYSQALAMREKDIATLIFKMRKALMK